MHSERFEMVRSHWPLGTADVGICAQSRYDLVREDRTRLLGAAVVGVLNGTGAATDEDVGAVAAGTGAGAFFLNANLAFGVDLVLSKSKSLSNDLICYNGVDGMNRLYMEPTKFTSPIHIVFDHNLVTSRSPRLVSLRILQDQC